MKYTAKEIEENYNVSKVNPMEKFVRIISVIALVVLGLYFVLSLMINIGVEYIPESWDTRLGEYLEKNIEDIDSEKSLELEKRIYDLLGENSYSVKIIESDQLNAFAVPGKNILVYSALAEKLTDKEMDFVLLHEIGHFRNRDVSKKYARLFLFSSFTVFLNSSDDTDILNKIVFGTEMKFSQKAERDADIFAAEVFYKNYGNIDAVESFFQKVFEDENNSKLAYYFATHPHPDKRIEEIRNYIKSLN